MIQIKQPDVYNVVDVSPPAFVWNPYLTLTLTLKNPVQVPKHTISFVFALTTLTFDLTLTFEVDLEVIKIHPHAKLCDLRYYSYRNMN